MSDDVAFLAPKTDPLWLWIDYNQRLLQLCRSETGYLVCFDWQEEVYMCELQRLYSKIGLPEPHYLGGLPQPARQYIHPGGP